MLCMSIHIIPTHCKGGLVTLEGDVNNPWRQNMWREFKYVCVRDLASSFFFPHPQFQWDSSLMWNLCFSPRTVTCTAWVPRSWWNMGNWSMRQAATSSLMVPAGSSGRFPCIYLPFAYVYLLLCGYTELLDNCQI